MGSKTNYSAVHKNINTQIIWLLIEKSFKSKPATIYRLRNKAIWQQFPFSIQSLKNVTSSFKNQPLNCIIFLIITSTFFFSTTSFWARTVKLLQTEAIPGVEGGKTSNQMLRENTSLILKHGTSIPRFNCSYEMINKPHYSITVLNSST